MAAADRIVLFTAALARDGVARNTVNLANHLWRRGCRVEVVCLSAGPLGNELHGPSLICLGKRVGPRPLALLLAIPALRRYLGRSFSTVVSMGNHAHLAVWAALRGLGDLPRVYRISNDPLHPGGHALTAAWRNLGLRLISTDATRLASVSGVAVQRRAFAAARAAGRVEVIRNGVDAEAIAARAGAPCDHPWLSDGRPYLVAVGRLHRQKNCEALIDAVALLRAQQHPDLRLLILGRGEPEVRRGLERLAQALGVEEAVRLDGEVANPFPLVTQAAAYVLPSLWEGASNSLLEALACRVPVVAAKTAGNAAEVLAGGRYGVLAEPHAASLARAISIQLDPVTRIAPQDRAQDFALAGALDRMARLILSAPAAHDEIQMQRAGRRHQGPVDRTPSGGAKEI